MRRFWLTILLTIALGVGSVANAAAAHHCPMQQAGSMEQAVVMAHDGCMDGAPGAPGAPDQRDMDDCVMGMACRTAPTLQLSVPLVVLRAIGVRLTQPIETEAPPPSGPLQDLFRPPRTI
jgi:hypothetical protein